MNELERILTGGGQVFNHQQAVAEGVFYAEGQVSGEAALSAHAESGKGHIIVFGVGQVKEHFVKSAVAAVQAAAAVVFVQGVFFPVYIKPAVFNSVCHTATHRAEISAVFLLFIPGQAVISENHIPFAAVFVRDCQALYCGAVVQHAQAVAQPVGQGVSEYFVSVFVFSEKLFFHISSFGG